ncbi:MAG: hypothetical protein SFW62_04660 [Alphaproteobacteria bacterium]|nr:hypothetical protein [Alphaproteobacteria bacterium]
MDRIFNICRLLPYPCRWAALFLTFICAALAPFSTARATEERVIFIPVPGTEDRSATSPIDVIEKNRRLNQLLDYVRKEGPGWVPGLSGAFRSPFRAAGEFFGFDSLSEEDGFFVPLFQPVSSWMQSPSVDEAQAVWLSPEYRHKGFLPLHDSLIAGVNFRHRAWSERVQFDVRPFYGQNWLSTNGHWGVELGIGLRRLEASEPWGRVVVRYNDGDPALMDNGRGIDMHTEIKFDPNLTLHAGVRNNETSDLGNYVLLRWKLTDFGP